MVKVKEVKHSDEDLSSEGEEYGSDNPYGDEYGEEDMSDGILPFEDLAEEGEVDMSGDYDEEEALLDAASELMNESGESDISDLQESPEGL